MDELGPNCDSWLGNARYKMYLAVLSVSCMLLRLIARMCVD
jgi:hypothetical protein